MKNPETYSIKMDMREDLMKCYNEVAPTCYTQYSAWKKTVRHPAKRIYMTTKQVVQTVSQYLRGNKEVIEVMKPNKKRLYKYVISRVLELSQQPQFQNKKLTRIVDYIIHQPAPEFFLSPIYMKLIFYRCKFKLYDKNGMLIQKEKNNNHGTVHQPTHTDIQ